MRPKIYTHLLVVVFLMLCTTSVWAQNVQVRGVVSDETGAPLPGVTILVKGTTTGTTTDIDGQYAISSPSNATLVFSFIGYTPIERAVGNQSEINISLEPDLSELDEVIVVGYGTAKKSQLTGAISSVGNKEIQELPITDARQALQ